jgi:hypothetical protein
VHVIQRGHAANEKRVAFTLPIDRSGREVRLPSGFLADVWQFTLSGTTPLQAFHVASSVAELRGA